MTDFEGTIGVLEIPSVEKTGMAKSLLELIEESDEFTSVFHGERPHDDTRMYRVEVE